MNKFMFFLAIVSLACGATAAIPTDSATRRSPAYAEPTEAQYIPVRATDTNEIIQTLGQLNVRACPGTDCAVIRVMAEGETAYVGQLIVNDDWNCHKWLPLEAEAGFICQEWTAYIK